MAPSSGLRMAEGHRQAQVRLADELARAIVARWGATVTRPGQGDQFLEDAQRLIRVQHRASVALAATYYNVARRLEVPGAARIVRPQLVDEAVVTSLVAAGFKSLSDGLAAGNTLEDALTVAAGNAAGASVRHALSGGRRTIIDTAAEDLLAVGYQRITRQGCCYFCAALASRGPVYKGDSFAESDPRFIGEGEVKVHDLCRCSMQAVFKRGEPLPDLNQQFQDLWNYTRDHGEGRGKSGNDMMNAFRRAYTASLAEAPVSS